jgi:hypothetical protein
MFLAIPSFSFGGACSRGFESGFTGFLGLTISSLVLGGRILLDGDIISLSLIVYASANSMLINF